jgi:hypothetical protein
MMTVPWVGDRTRIQPPVVSQSLSRIRRVWSAGILISHVSSVRSRDQPTAPSLPVVARRRIAVLYPDQGVMTSRSRYSVSITM